MSSIRIGRSQSARGNGHREIVIHPPPRQKKNKQTNKQTNKDKSGKIWMFVLWLYEPSHMQSKTENKTLSTNENIITKFPNKNLVVGRKVCLES